MQFLDVSADNGMMQFLHLTNMDTKQYTMSRLGGRRDSLLTCSRTCVPVSGAMLCCLYLVHIFALCVTMQLIVANVVKSLLGAMVMLRNV